MIKLIFKKNENFEVFMKKFKDILKKIDLMEDIKKKINYKKPSIIKKEKKLNKVKYLQKKIRSNYFIKKS